MANNKEPIAKKCRSLDISPAVMGYGNKKSNRNPGGNKRKKVSEYGTQLKEKQKVKFVYGVLEKQFHRYYVKAANMKGITGENLLKLLELRLDNVIYRLGLAKTRRMARQIVVHGHILVDGNKVDRPSYRVKPGQTIQVRAKSQTMEPFVQAAEGVHRDVLPAVPGYLDVNLPSLKATLTRIPEPEEIPVQVNIQYVVEYYSR